MEYYKADITQKIIKCAFKVHNNLSNGFQEVIYQRALAYEFARENLIFESKKYCKKHLCQSLNLRYLWFRQWIGT